MARTFNSTGAGDWSDPTKWDYGSSKYPGDTVGETDTVNISHEIEYDVASPTEFINGQITINSGGILKFATDQNTLLHIGNVNLQVNSGGELRVGSVANPIPAAYLAKILWNMTADNSKGLRNSGTVNLNGHPDYYGSVRAGTLYSDWTSVATGDTSTIYVTENVSSKWASGQDLIMNFLGGTTSTTDAVILQINGSVTWDGTKSTVPVYVIHNPRTTGDVFLAHSRMFHLSRNVILGKYGASKNHNNFNTLRPFICYSNDLDITSLNSVEFHGVYRIGSNSGLHLSDVVVRNSYFSLQLYSDRWGAQVIDKLTVANIYYLHLYRAIVSDLMIAKTSGLDAMNSTIKGMEAFQSAIINYASNSVIYDGYLYSLYYPMSRAYKLKFVDTQFGYTPDGTAASNNTPFAVTGSLFCDLVNCKVDSATTQQNSTSEWCALRHIHKNQVKDAIESYYTYATVTKVEATGTGDTPSQRSGGNLDILEIIPQSNCSDDYPCEFGLGKIYLPADSYTITLYYQSEANETVNGAEFIVGGLNGTGGGLTDTASTESIAVRSGVSDWSHYFTVSFTQAADGWAELKFRMMDYFGSGNYLWIDPLVGVSPLPSGVTSYEIEWIDGDPWMIPVSSGGGGLLVHPGMRGGLNG